MRLRQPRPFLFALCVFCFAQSAWAAPPVKDPDLTLIESTERDEDPLGLDEATGSGLDVAAEALPAKKPDGPPPPSPERGDVLSAIPSVRERSHRVGVRFAQGLAFVETEITFENRGPHAAEVAYRLAVPEDAVPLSLAACTGETCAETEWFTEAPPTSLIHAHAERLVDGRGNAFSLRARPITDVPLTLRIRYVCEAKLMGGRILWTLPARGFDPRIAPAEMHIDAPGFVITGGTDVVIDPSHPYAAHLELSKARLENRMQVSCDQELIVRTYSARKARAFDARETWILLDSSPSMEGPARSRAPVVLASLLSELPEQTPLVAFGFAARAQRLGDYRAGDAPLSKLTDAFYEERGGGTKPSSALSPLIDEIARTKPRIVIISDGRLDPSNQERRALERAAQKGAELWLVALSDEAPEPRIADLFRKAGGTLWITRLADRALVDQDLSRLFDALSPILTPHQGPGPRAGSEMTTVASRPSKRPRERGPNTWVCAWHKPDPARARLTIGTPSAPNAISAPAYESITPSEGVVESGLPKESVLSFLRTQLIPRARACLRSDRKGRANYAVGLAFHMTLARREALDASIEGQVPDELKRCLLDVLPTLKLPWFTGRLRVRYPIHTEREAEPPTIELEAETAATLNRALQSTKRDERVLKMR